jgi:hypothetical protein
MYMSRPFQSPEFNVGDNIFARLVPNKSVTNKSFYRCNNFLQSSSNVEPTRLQKERKAKEQLAEKHINRSWEKGVGSS